MLVRGVVDHQVDDQFHAGGLDRHQQVIEIRHGAKLGTDLAIVADIVAIISIG